MARFQKMLPHLLVAIGLAFPVIVSAQTFVPLAQIPSGPLSQLYNTPVNGDFSNFINSLFKFMLAAGAIGAVLRLAYAGYLYMGQSDMWSHKGEAKKIIGDVTLGLLLLLGIYLILYQINPDIVKLNALRNIGPVQQAPPAAAPPGTVLVPPDNPSIPDNTTCTLTDSNGKSYPGLFQGGTCRFAP